MPRYALLALEKKKCRPVGGQFEEHLAIVSMQSVLDHTTSRVLDSIMDTIHSLQRENRGRLLVIYFYFKYGCDGSSGFSKYKQQSENLEDDSTMFASNLVPLQMTCVVNGRRVTLYHNQLSNSPFGCRPLRFCFQKETNTVIRTEGNRMKNEAENLVPYQSGLNREQKNI
jgi:hypothetical protein